MNSVKNKYHQMAMSEEETIITMREKSLPFSSVKLQDLELTLLKNETNGMLSIAQLRKAMTELNFELEIFTSPESHIKNLLKLLQNSKKLYDHKTVMLFGIVLGIGTPREKAEVLFKLYDAKSCGFLNRSEVADLIDEIFEVSVNKIPKVAIDDSDEPEKFTLTEKRIDDYSQSLFRKKRWFTSRALSSFFAGTGQISKEHFLRKIAEDSMLEALIWSYQLRLVLLD